MNNTSLRVLTVVGATLLLAACERKLTGPAPTVTSALPAAVCAEQLTTTLAIAGEGLSPLVTDSLTATPLLNLPAVSLVPEQDLTGAPADGDPVLIPDDPSTPATSRARWTSQQAMEVDLFPELSLVPGLYGLRVANRNGQTADFADAVLAVPPPALAAAMPDLLCSDEPADVVLTGDFFIRSATLQPTVSVGGKTLVPKAMADCRRLPGPAGLEACKSLTVTIAAKALALGTHAFVVRNPETVACASTATTVTVTVVPAPTLAAVVPDLTCTAQGTTQVVVTGTGFLNIDGVTATLVIGTERFPGTLDDCTNVTGVGLREQVRSCATLRATIPLGALPPAGPFSAFAAKVANPAPAGCETKESVNFVTVPAPTLTSVVPDLTCTAQGTTDLLVTGTGFLSIDGATATLVIGTESFAGMLSDCTSVSAPGLRETVLSCITLRATVPMGALPPTGLLSAFDTKVVNPAPAGCETKDSIPFATVPAPTLTSVVPDLTCTAQGTTDVVATGTGFLTVGSAAATLLIGTQSFPGALQGCTDVSVTGLREQVRSCTTLRATIPLGALAPTGAFSTFAAKVVNPATAGCETKESINFTTVPPPTLLSAAPDLVCTAAGAVSITITGTGFISSAPDALSAPALPRVTVGSLTLTPTAAAGCTAVTGPVENVRSCTSLTVQIPQGTPAGLQTVSVTNPAPAGCTASQTITVVLAPPPVVTSLTPDIASAVEADVALTIQGTGFLKLGTTLPGVQVGALTLTATAATGCSLVTGTTTGAETCTGLTVTVPRSSPTGQQPVVVINPAPASCSSTPRNIYLAPAPLVARLTPPGLCVGSTGTTAIVLEGAEFLRLGGASVPAVTIGTRTYVPVVDASSCASLPGYSQSLERCTLLTVNISGTDFPISGTFNAVVRNPAPAAASSAPVQFSVTVPPTLASVTPARVCSGGGALTLTGTNFTSTMQVRLQSPSPEQAVSITLTSATTAIATFAGPLPVGGPYDVTVTTAAGACSATLTAQVTVTPGPVVYFVDPPVVYNGINTQATVYASGFSASGLTVSIRLNGTSTLQTVASSYNPSKANRILVTLPSGLAPGSYDVFINDSVTTQCPGQLLNAFRVVNALTLTLTGIDPPFGSTLEDTAVTITANGTVGGGLKALPRLYLNPTSGTGVAIPLESVSLISSSRVTAVVPAGELAGTYDLIVVNPDGGVGFLPAAFRVLNESVPFINSVSPQYLISQQTAAAFDIAGGNFRTPTVQLRCKDTTGNLLNVNAAVVGTPTGSAISATVNTGTLPNGTVCVVRATNGDSSYAEYSAIVITTPAQKPTGFTAGPAMLTARRWLVSEAGDVTRAAQFLYAIGGDDGAATPSSFDTVESAPLDIFGVPAPFFAQRYRMTVPRAAAAGQRVGRWLYVGGGRSGASVHATLERSYLLDPKDRVVITDLDLQFIEGSGLAGGTYTYRVAAVMSATDPFNPAGENLPSDPFPINVPVSGGSGTVLTLRWAPVTGATRYRVYRTARDGASGTEVLLAEVNSPGTSYIDDGTVTPTGLGPLPLGSTGVWTLAGTLPSAREGAGATLVTDPTTPGLVHLYFVGGRNAAGTMQNTAIKVPITIASDASQTVGTIASSASTLGTARWQLGVVTANKASAPIVGTAQYVYAYGGSTGVGTTGATQAAQVLSNGDLGAWVTVTGMSPTRGGFAPVVVNDFLYAFGGVQLTTPQSSGSSSQLTTPVPALGNWQSTSAQMTARRFLPGSTVQGAFFYVLGGQTDTLPATQSTDRVVW